MPKRPDLQGQRVNRPVTELYVICSYPLQSDAIAASDNCNYPADSAVMDPNSGYLHYRCSLHRGLLNGAVRGEVLTEVPVAPVMG